MCPSAILIVVAEENVFFFKTSHVTLETTVLSCWCPRSAPKLVSPNFMVIMVNMIGQIIGLGTSTREGLLGNLPEDPVTGS